MVEIKVIDGVEFWVICIPVTHTPLDDLSGSSQKVLSNAGISTIEDLLWRSEREVKNLPNMGKKSLEEIKNAMQELIGLPIGALVRFGQK